ncbi:carbohydrate ABC transporter substrate-binding protein, CUT1 family [Faunimonas pinastri]|uniref:sn-glycerol-3-phosphate-binding periplasmic protein UgpB n=1 Tax=Faunimonas pinastri TaxID=1855383 RepID=A0A1H9H0C0_9HYPH|nr:sugar ABC transporter substrate-binding protein [Faunimonas pinastri]SEQ55688.1 carbohydrate ABC transporter substrate-binding protein, CUT1 family [Faunimonas pinastri]
MKISRSARVTLGASVLALLASSSAGFTAPVTLRWAMSADSQAEIGVWQHLADMVHAKYPDITVTFESTAFSDYYNKLVTEAAADDLPCIAGLQAQRIPDVGSIFIDLSSKLGSGLNIGEYQSSIVDGLKQDGKQLAIPYDLGPYVVYYNKTMFKAAGLALPKPGWTSEEFLADAKKLTADGHHGFVADGTPDMWLPFVLSIGGDYMKDGAPDLDNAKMVQGFTWVTDLATKEKVAPQIPATGASNYPADQFRNGNAAMYIDGPWQLINAKQNVKFDIGLTTVPSFGGKSVTTMSGTGFGITKSCQDPDAAWKAISVIVGPEGQNYIAKAGRGFPAYKAAQTYWYSVADVDGAKGAIDTALATVNVYKTTPKWNRIAALLQQYGVEAFNGSSSPQAVLTEVQNQVE